MISVLNDRITRRLLKKGTNGLVLTSVLRQAINIAYLIGVFAVGSATKLNLFALLLGAAFGITLPMFFFTARLLKGDPGSGEEAGKDG